ncbi:deoxyribodipyrimidine photo-lyase [Arthrobacter sp. JZ12]|uniref:cryptochrome/photolyase family protein n=1 Tax=Arthrobacter sp. JZ12 TaxID=2654190 RepID=UPI002B49021C|nr:deoxyribodipyrimidine photo-lyase [Arthrobacter sp. JZ12]WRH25433.1 deoxyribodipyrimidine photo-lyase [Arthrobacter sp. JZ12]
MPLTLVWLRDDLRVSDNPALQFAAERGDVVVCYVLDEESPNLRPLGGASRWWLHHSLASLAESLRALGAGLVLRSGPAETVIPELVQDTGADAVVWNRRYGSAERTVDAGIKARLSAIGREVHSFQANLLFEPWTVTTADGSPYRMYSPFWRACLAQPFPRAPLDPPAALSGPVIGSENLADWHLLPSAPDWAGGLRETWTPGEPAAQGQLARFLEEAIDGYADARQLPHVEGTSRLSPHLRFGEASPFQVWHAASLAQSAVRAPDLTVFTKELGWREFCWQLLYHNPGLADENYRTEFNAFPWQTPDPAELRSWQRGLTGYPLIDAGMRQLWHTGWMHNRVRMAVASFLVKNMMVDWRVGEQWFWDTLVDADPANNAANWQWVAGSGADAAPYFRIFNPVTQSRKFDAAGEYIRRWVPELRGAEDVHEPWRGPRNGYPLPLLDLKESRERALTAYRDLRRN